MRVSEIQISDKHHIANILARFFSPRTNTKETGTYQGARDLDFFVEGQGNEGTDVTSFGWELPQCREKLSAPVRSGSEQKLLVHA